MRQTKKVKEQYQENAICVSRTELPQLNIYIGRGCVLYPLPS